MMQLQRKIRWSVSSGAQPQGETGGSRGKKGGRSMTGIEGKIRQWCAAATVEEAGERVVVVPDRDLAEVCRRLHDDAEEPMDSCGTLWRRTATGASVFYQLESTRTGGRVTLRTDTDGRGEPFPALGVRDMEDGGNQGTRGIRFLRHTLHGSSRHAPPLPARGLGWLPAPQGLRHGRQPARHGERGKRRRDGRI